MDTPVISIIVPCYNVENYLYRCMDSLTRQTLKNIEIILVDDGSPDKVPEICDEWQLKDQRVKVVHKRNEGLGLARNTGLKIASGKYVAFVDSDDYVDVNMYQILLEIAERKNSDAVFCGFKKGIQEGKFVEIRECNSYKEFSGDEVRKLIPDFIAAPPYSKQEYIYEMSVWHSIYRRSIIVDNEINFVSEREFSSEDIPFQLDFLEKAQKISFIPNILYFYCWNGNSITKKVSEEKFYKIVALYKLVSSKSVKYDDRGLRAKRLFIGYIRAYVRTLTKTNMKYKEKMHIINVMFKHNVWDEVASEYSIDFLPFGQKILSKYLLDKNSFGTYWCAKLMEIVKKNI